jgi:hypothetical protein
LKYHGTGLKPRENGLKPRENGENKPQPMALEETSLLGLFERYEAFGIAWL